MYETKPAPLAERKAPVKHAWTRYVDHMTQEIHIVPNMDLVAHPLTDDCVCGPSAKILTRDGNPDYHEFTHHSLDGRELAE